MVKAALETLNGPTIKVLLKAAYMLNARFMQRLRRPIELLEACGRCGGYVARVDRTAAPRSTIRANSSAAELVIA